jgi:hypothetical protein
MLVLVEPVFKTAKSENGEFDGDLQKMVENLK